MKTKKNKWIGLLKKIYVEYNTKVLISNISSGNESKNKIEVENSIKQVNFEIDFTLKEFSILFRKKNNETKKRNGYNCIKIFKFKH